MSYLDVDILEVNDAIVRIEDVMNEEGMPVAYAAMLNQYIDELRYMLGV